MMDTNIESTTTVHLEEGEVMKFKEVELGLHFFSNHNNYNIKNLALIRI